MVDHTKFRHMYPDPPEEAAAFHFYTGHPIMVTRGKYGFTPVLRGFNVVGFNETIGVTEADLKQMLREAGVV